MVENVTIFLTNVHDTLRKLGGTFGDSCQPIEADERVFPQVV